MMVDVEKVELVRTDNGDGTTSIEQRRWEQTSDGGTWATATIEEGLRLKGDADEVFYFCFQECNNAFDALLLQAYIMENRVLANA